MPKDNKTPADKYAGKKLRFGGASLNENQHTFYDTRPVGGGDSAYLRADYGDEVDCSKIAVGGQAGIEYHLKAKHATLV